MTIGICVSTVGVFETHLVRTEAEGSRELCYTILGIAFYYGQQCNTDHTYCVECTIEAGVKVNLACILTVYDYSE